MTEQKRVGINGGKSAIVMHDSAINTEFEYRNTVGEIQKRMRLDGYAIVLDRNSPFNQSVLGENFRSHILSKYHDSDNLKPEEYDILPYDRKRARDVIRYYRQGDSFQFEEHNTTAIGSRSYDAPERREYSRVELLLDPTFKDFIERATSLVPPEALHEQGTIGINLFRTYTDVVSRPHQDDEEFVLLYVVDKLHAAGAETSLYELDGSKPLCTVTLSPGDFILFDDRRFRHGTTPLESVDDTSPQRDTIVMTFNKPETYPLVAA
jgi:hypothetical protein